MDEEKEGEEKQKKDKGGATVQAEEEAKPWVFARNGKIVWYFLSGILKTLYRVSPSGHLTTSVLQFILSNCCACRVDEVCKFITIICIYLY